MPNSTKIILKATGLVDAPNNLSLPDGSLELAENVIIKREGVIEPRRGYKIVGSELLNNDTTIKTMFEYHDRLLRYYDDKIQKDSTGEFEFVDFDGSYKEASDKLRTKTVESNGNLYFTSDKGIKKLSAKSGSDLTNATIEEAGGIKALDFDANLVYEYGKQNGIVEQDSKVSYRIVYNKRDRNNILIQGAPSQTVTVENPISKLLVQDYTKILDGLDQINVTGTTDPYYQHINDGNYVNSLVLPITASGSELKTNLLQLVKKIDRDINLASASSVSAPFVIDTIDIIGATDDQTLKVTLTTSQGDFTEYLIAGDAVEFTEFVQEGSGSDITYFQHLNEKQFIISEITSTSISFIYDNNPNEPLYKGTIVTSITNKPNMYYMTFRSIPEPMLFSTIETHGQFISLQEYITNIISTLQSLSIKILPHGVEYDKYIDTLTLTTSLDVKIKSQIPSSLTTSHFVQVYRTTNFTTPNELNINDITPNEEFQLAYEEYISEQNITDGYIEVVDITNDSFLGAYLYTNDATGEGDVNANFKPPFAIDINRFKNVTFFAGTRTQHRMKLDLVGIEQIRNLNDMKISVTRENESVTYSLVQGVKQEYTIQTLADNTNSLDDTYFIVPSHEENTIYTFFYSTDDNIDQPDVSPSYPNYTIHYIRIQINTDETAEDVATITADKINTIINTFEVSDVTTDIITFNVIKEKQLTDIVDGGTSFTFTTTVQGLGEDVTSKRAIVSSSPSTAIALDETARSLMKIINLSVDSFISGYYLSRASDIPGKMFFEANDLNGEPFYITANSKTLGQAFNPSIDEQFSVSNIDDSIAGQTTFTIPNHGLGDGNQIIVTNSINNTDKIYTVSVIDNDTFFVIGEIEIGPINLSVSAINYAQISENDDKKNRVYYSKFQQPEAVPLSNYFDIGNEDKAILRIYPLRDSLFVFKEDGLYRISGETAPFSVQLMDSSYILIASDSVSIVDNLVYAWTTKGIQALSESGGRVISGNIDNIVYKLGSSQFENFNKATFSIGYESDNSVIFYTIQSKTDTVATVGLRYSTKTATWSTFDQQVTCGLLNPFDDKVYLGASDVSYMLQERKLFDRTDYADREFISNIGKDKVLPDNVIALNNFDMSLLEVGYVMEQVQSVTSYDYNMLLKKIDLDSGTLSDYHSTLESIKGDKMNEKMVALANKLDSDVGSSFETFVEPKQGTITNVPVGNTALITSVGHELIENRVVIISGTTALDGEYKVHIIDNDTFEISKVVFHSESGGTFVTATENTDDLRVIYNELIDEMNVDPNINFHNYEHNTIDSSFESIITDIDLIRKRVTVNLDLNWLVGDILFYQSITSNFLYRPITMDDPMGLKHLRESTLMFEDNQFTSASVGFSTDLMPQIVEVGFDMNGNGIFGNQVFGSALFGGVANHAPFRTYIPREKQRCTYIQILFKHNIAREKFALLSTTVTGNISTSSRAYR